MQHPSLALLWFSLLCCVCFFLIKQSSKKTSPAHHKLGSLTMRLETKLQRAERGEKTQHALQSSPFSHTTGIQKSNLKARQTVEGKKPRADSV